jgi:hypothetical protein
MPAKREARFAFGFVGIIIVPAFAPFLTVVIARMVLHATLLASYVAAFLSYPLVLIGAWLALRHLAFSRREPAPPLPDPAVPEEPPASGALPPD